MGKFKANLICILLLFLLVVFNFFEYTPFTINLSPSVPCGIYFVIPKIFQADYQKGDMVLFEVPVTIKQFMIQREYIDKNTYLLKQIQALEGDTYYVDDKAIHVNDEYVGDISTRDSLGRSIIPQYGKHHVNKGYFLPIGLNNKNSYDGRYFGEVPIKNIKNKVIPLIIFTGK